MENGSNKNRIQGPERMHYNELCIFVKERKCNWIRTADRIKAMSLKNNFSHDADVISEHFHESKALFNDLFRDIKLVTTELKDQFKFKQKQIVEAVKEEQPENSEQESPRIRAIKNEVNDLAMLAQAVSEDIGDMLAELYDLLKDSALNTHITNSILSEYGIQLDPADPIHLTKPAIKSSIYRGMKPIITQRLVPKRSDEDKSGITTYEEILRRAMLSARQSRVSLSELDPRIAADQEEITHTINRTIEHEREIKPGTRTITPGSSKKVTEKPNQLITNSPAVPPEAKIEQVTALPQMAESASTPTPEPARSNQEKKIPAKELPAEKTLQTETEVNKDQFVPDPEIDPDISENPFKVQKSTRRKLWTMLGAGAAVVAAGLIGQSAVNSCSQEEQTVTVASTNSDKESDNEKTTAESEKFTQESEKEASSPVKYTVNTDHADYARYLQNFKGMHAFQADLNFAAGHTEVELSGNETPNELKIKVLRKYLEAGAKTATSAFSQKAFSMYLKNLDRLEKEIKDGIANLDDENLMEDGSYQQIRIMAEGIKNVVRTVPPENIEGYKITRTACHPYEVFTHNYLDQGGAPAFHTTVVKTLENIEEDPFKRGDSGYVTTEFFKRLHRQAAVQRAQNKVDGSPAVASSIERYIRSGGNNSISDMLRTCVVPIYRTDINATPEPEIENTVAPSKGKAIPIDYSPEPSPTGLFDLDKLDELDSGWDLPADNTPEIEITGEEYVELSEEDLLDDDSPEIEVTGEEYVELPDKELPSEEDFFYVESPSIKVARQQNSISPALTPVKPPAPPVKESWLSRAASKLKSIFA